MDKLINRCMRILQYCSNPRMVMHLSDGSSDPFGHMLVGQSAVCSPH